MKTPAAFACSLAFAGLACATGAATFEAADANRDGRVTAQEHQAHAARLFAAMDRDRDGVVTADEMDAAQPKVGTNQAPTKPMTSAQKIQAVDGNKDGKLSAAEHEAGAKAMFGRMDANRDGALSAPEWEEGHAKLMKAPG